MRGGKRENSGRKQKYNEPTVYIGFRVPLSMVAEIKDLVKSKLDRKSLQNQK